jgi:hypothetical protein
MRVKHGTFPLSAWRFIKLHFNLDLKFHLLLMEAIVVTAQATGAC